MAQPFGLVAVAIEVEAAHKGLVATHDHHDQQVRDHHHVNQRQHHQHDHRFIKRGDGRFGLVANGVDQRLQGGLIAKRGLHQVGQFDQKVHHIHRLRNDQAQVQRQLQPAAGKDQAGQGAQGGSACGCRVRHGGYGFSRKARF